MQTYQEVKRIYKRIISESETELRLVLRNIRYLRESRRYMFTRRGRKREVWVECIVTED